MPKQDFSRSGPEWRNHSCWQNERCDRLWEQVRATRTTQDIADLYEILRDKEYSNKQANEVMPQVVPLLEAIRPDGTFPHCRREEINLAQASAIFSEFAMPIGNTARCILTTPAELAAPPAWVSKERIDAFENECRRWGDQGDSMRNNLGAQIDAYLELPMTYQIESWARFRFFVEVNKIADGFAWHEKYIMLMNAAGEFYNCHGDIASVGFKRSGAYMRAGAIGTYLALMAWGEYEQANKVPKMLQLLGKTTPIGALGTIWQTSWKEARTPHEDIEVLLVEDTKN